MRLLKQGADTEEMDDDVNPPLIDAVRNNSIDVARLLLGKGDFRDSRVRPSSSLGGTMATSRVRRSVMRVVAILRISLWLWRKAQVLVLQIYRGRGASCGGGYGEQSGAARARQGLVGDGCRHGSVQ